MSSISLQVSPSVSTVTHGVGVGEGAPAGGGSAVPDDDAVAEAGVVPRLPGRCAGLLRGGRMQAVVPIRALGRRVHRSFPA